MATELRRIESLLRHPIVVPVKRATKDLWWRYKGLSIANPPLPARVGSVLFVCLGNICRSPFAEAIASERLAALPGRKLRFGSAGIRVTQGAAPPPEARRVAARLGLSLDAHRPQPLTPELIRAYDLIVVMEAGQMDDLRSEYAVDASRVVLLSLFDAGARGRSRYVIADPFGQSEHAYVECYRRIDRAVTALIAALA
jgi:protein-tyrosine phosphatase